MFTPAQKPRGLARMTFTTAFLLRCRYRTAAGPGRQANCGPQTASPPAGVAMRPTRILWPAGPGSFELDLAGGDDLLAVFFRDRALDAALLGLAANLLVVGLVGLLVEVVHGLLAVFLDHDDGGALVFLAQVALGAGDRAGQGLLFLLALVLGLGERHEGQRQAEN